MSLKLKTLFVGFFLLSIFFSCKKKHKNHPVAIDKKDTPLINYGINYNNYIVINDTVKKGESFGVILDRYHINYPKINEITSKIKDTFDVRKIRVGKPYTILTSKDSTKKAQIFIYKHDKINSTIINFKDSLINFYKFKKPIKYIERKISGKITTNFSKVMDSLGIRASLVNEIADIYAWTLDFYRLNKEDTFKLIFEEKFINDSISVGYGKIKAALFNHKGKKLYAYRFIADTLKKIPNYYDNKAILLQRQFLKSPIKFQYRISSKYNLKRRIKLYGNKIRPHKGTDFAAKYGTEIIATANGTVIESTRKGGNGNYVKIRHNNTYSTQYLHMKRRKVLKGDYVKQGEVIGWVGLTGNTTGPHVCYRFWKNGVQVDPYKQKFKPVKPLNKNLKHHFFNFIKPLKQKLDNIPLNLNDTFLKNKKDIIAKN